MIDIIKHDITEQDNVWFTADHHFGHANIIKYTRRPFADAIEMDKMLVERWNEVVRPEDTVFHLGDFTLAARMPYVDKLSGRIRVVPGGHDFRWLRQKTCPVEVLPPLVTLEFETGGAYPLVVVLCHYPMLSWDRSHYGSIHLHGHTHGTVLPGRSSDVKMPPGQKQGCRLDIGVDCWDFRPVNLRTITETVQSWGEP